MPVNLRQRNIHARHVGRKPMIGKIANKKNSWWKSNKKIGESDLLVTNARTDSAGIWFPSPTTAVLCLLCARLAAASCAHITDCDETYNYWEPLHYLIYSNGMQTWEYSPAYAIRSYAPLFLLAAPARLLRLLLDTGPTVLFYLLRCLLAVGTAAAEGLFYRAVCHQFGVHAGRIWLLLSLVSCGGYISSAALLPSAWCNALATAALAYWWLGRLQAAVFCTAVSALVAWPFAGLLGAPIAIDIIFYRRRYVDFVKWCAVSLAAILPPLIAVDSWYYGKVTLAPWNIVKYNIFTEHGPDLYGVEPLSFYFVNGFLNFNITWVLALMCPLWLCVCWLLIPRAEPRLQLCRPYWLSLMPLYIWLAVFLPQPHKEERFLFPVYSMITLCGAISVDCVQKLTFTLKMQLNNAFDKYFGGSTDTGPTKRHYLAHTNFVAVILVGVAMLGGVSRIAALYRNYHAPMSILRALPPAPPMPVTGVVDVCLGKDWYRSPSSFHLPSERYRVRFVSSEFSGQLPAQYATGDNATRIIHEYFNDGNNGDARTYLNATDCHYLVDTDVEPPTLKQPPYASLTSRWAVEDSLPLLNAAESHKLFRAFYIPFLDEYTVFGKIYLLRNKRLVPKA